MLHPDDRRTLLDALRPPEGCRLDYAVATTFSLDLIALLTAPLAFTFHEWDDGDGRPVDDPLALFETLRRHADNLAVFCQADRIAVPGKVTGLLSFLEESVVPVRAPRAGGLFHPKIWLLRFVAADDMVRYRLLVSSRNLTFDRSWDTLLTLDGELEDRQVGFGYLRPLGEFIAALPGLGRNVPPGIAQRVTDIGQEVRRVRFEFPDEVTEVAFWPMGLAGYSAWPFPSDGRRVAIISPFLTADMASRLAGLGEERVLISEVGELDRLGKDALADYDDVRVLSPTAWTTDEDSAQDGLLGLHAKLYIVEKGKRVHVWTGSANATNAGFGINVELLVQLRAKRKAYGIESLLAEGSGDVTFASLLEPYVPPDEPNIDEEAEAARKAFDAVRAALAGLPLLLNVTQESTDGTFTATLTGPAPDLPLDVGDVAIACRPISFGKASAKRVALDDPVEVQFEGIPFGGLTSFIAFELRLSGLGWTREEQFVLNVPMRGVPEGRRQRIIQDLLSDEQAVLRFILMLLAPDAELSAADLADAVGSGGGAWALGFGEDTVLESLLRALVREPERLDRVARLLEDLGDGDTAPRLPEQFMKVWEPVWSARREAR